MIDYAYDVFVLRTSGLPLLAGCTGTEYCKMHRDNHELQAGFLSALHAFSKEAFSTETLTKIDLSEIQLNFKYDPIKEILFIAFHSIDQQSDRIQKQLDNAVIKFQKRYPHELPNYIKRGEYDDFKDDLMKIGLIHDQLNSILDVQENSKKERLANWIKSILDKL